MSQRYVVKIQPRAEEDISGAYDWILTHAPEYADDWFNGLQNDFSRLETFPERFPLAPENRFGRFDVEIRQMFYGNGFWKYRVLFFIEEHTVQVIHVRHGARRWLGEE